MSKEHKKRPPVFTPAEEELDDILAAEISEEHITKSEIKSETALEAVEDVHPAEDEQETDLEAVEDVHPAESETGDSSDVLPHGWRLIGEEQQNGKQYIVSSELEEEGIKALWRKTRVLKHSRWVIHGKWSDALTRRDVLPQPRYYKEI